MDFLNKNNNLKILSEQARTLTMYVRCDDGLYYTLEEINRINREEQLSKLLDKKIEEK